MGTTTVSFRIYVRTTKGFLLLFALLNGTPCLSNPAPIHLRRTASVRDWGQVEALLHRFTELR